MCLAHSVGGQLIGLAANNADLQGVLAVALPSGFWGHWSGVPKIKIAAAWFVLMPLLPRLFGHLPAWVLGSLPLPPGVARQWAYWGRHHDYICDERGHTWRPYFAQITAPMVFYAAADDLLLAPEPAVRALAGFYEHAHQRVEVLHPSDFNCRHIGHFGFFQKTAPLALWEKAVSDLRGML